MVAITLLLALSAFATPDDSGIHAPAGFDVVEFAGPALANDIFSMTMDPHGRVVVSGRGYIRILVDDDGDAHADRAITFADGPADGAQGMFWEGSSLYVIGDGGLRRYRDDDGDDRADGPSELLFPLKTGGEHDAHDIKRGPDGWLYVLCGNMTGVDRRIARESTSPIRDPIAGCVIRFSPDFTRSEVVADGFRNAYRMDWNSAGELFTFDSDNERCVSLPWYEPTRFYHVVSGRHYGWLAPQRAQWFRLPPYFVDVAAPTAYLGRGSPTGVACYRAGQFPDRYRGGFFLADWTFGRVWFAPLEPHGASYRSQPEMFLESVGENGFAPTDLAVDSATGDLYVSIGGRGTRGSVYRVHYSGPADRAVPQEQSQSSRADLEWLPELAEALPAQARSANPRDRLHALNLIKRHFKQFTVSKLIEVVKQNWDDDDPTIRDATAELIKTLPVHTVGELRSETDRGNSSVTWGLAAFATHPAETVRLATALIDSATENRQLAGVRLLQLAWGDLAARDTSGTVWEGYTFAGRTDSTAIASREGSDYEAAVIALRRALSGSTKDLRREIARTLAALQDDREATLNSIAAQLSDASDPIDDIHFLAALSRIRGPRSSAITTTTARTLLALDRKITERGWNRDRHWPLRVAEIHEQLAHADPQLDARILADREFGRADHALLAQCPGFDRPQAARRLLDRAQADPSFIWTPAIVELVGNLGTRQSIDELRARWDDAGLQAAILQVLARDPQAEDRGKFREGLESPQLATVQLCLDALTALPNAHEPEDFLALVRLLRRMRGGKEEDRLRERAGQLLRTVSNQTIPAESAEEWTDWFGRSFPDLAGRLGGPDGVDTAAWRLRLQQLDWASGEASRGRPIFDRIGCTACHSGARAIGPDLRGAANRFSRDDLFTAIIQPSRDVSPRYQTTIVSTADGKVYQGTIIYEAVDSLILQTGAETTIRITNNQIAERRVTPNSLMPAGLLDKLTDREIADLYAFLRSLR